MPLQEKGAEVTNISTHREGGDMVEVQVFNRDLAKIDKKENEEIKKKTAQEE
jgi:hypothetical protein